MTITESIQTNKEVASIIVKSTDIVFIINNLTVSMLHAIVCISSEWGCERIKKNRLLSF